MLVMQIVHIRLKESALDTLSARAHARTQEWLTQWTPRANFKAVLAENQEKALARCNQMMAKELVPSWLSKESGVKPEMFEFEVSEQELKNDCFWMSSQCVWAHWHAVKPVAELETVPA